MQEVEGSIQSTPEDMPASNLVHEIESSRDDVPVVNVVDEIQEMGSPYAEGLYTGGPYIRGPYTEGPYTEGPYAGLQTTYRPERSNQREGSNKPEGSNKQEGSKIPVSKKHHSEPQSGRRTGMGLCCFKH
jgi:hypothetical protein